MLQSGILVVLMVLTILSTGENVDGSGVQVVRRAQGRRGQEEPEDSRAVVRHL